MQSKLFLTNVTIFIIISSIMGAHIAPDSSHSETFKKPSISALPRISLSSLSKSRFSYRQFQIARRNGPLPKFVNPQTLGRREFQKIMHIMRSKALKRIDLRKAKKGKITALDSILQRSVQKASALLF